MSAKKDSTISVEAASLASMVARNALMAIVVWVMSNNKGEKNSQEDRMSPLVLPTVIHVFLTIFV